MDNLIIPISAMADLDKGLKKTYLDMLFVTNDNEAHRVDVQLYRGKNPAELDGAGVSAYFIRYSDNATITLTGKASGNVVSVKMKKACYNKPGQFALIVKATIGGVTSTVFYGEGTIFVSSTEKVIDDEDIIPALDDLLDQIAAMEAASSRANTAADRVERMQIDASGLAGDANRLGGKAPSEYLQKSQVVNNFTTTEEGFVADARALAALDEKIASGLKMFNMTSSQKLTIKFRSLFGGMAIFIRNGNKAALKLCAFAGDNFTETALGETVERPIVTADFDTNTVTIEGSSSTHAGIILYGSLNSYYTSHTITSI